MNECSRIVVQEAHGPLFAIIGKFWATVAPKAFCCTVNESHHLAEFGRYDRAHEGGVTGRPVWTKLLPQNPGAGRVTVSDVGSVTGLIAGEMNELCPGRVGTITLLNPSEPMLDKSPPRRAAWRLPNRRATTCRLPILQERPGLGFVVGRLIDDQDLAGRRLMHEDLSQSVDEHLFTEIPWRARGTHAPPCLGGEYSQRWSTDSPANRRSSQRVRHARYTGHSLVICHVFKDIVDDDSDLSSSLPERSLSRPGPNRGYHNCIGQILQPSA
jgi:hypothetical protein